ncbi:hypothetical protein LAZ67_18001460 [Cordylochernes scorpioides]|uniref:Integrase catalytic domain-containing protein n=1 Tax=Cordylochernes scorpioides TaxID=51811 RepID=A0ABY6LKJ4_9ARAC|nr:hypothetical protein LAZ67_18001460 [Cordylochernes scorpioides]
MTRLISAQYYWQGMSKDSTQKVKTCPTCQLTKRPLGPTYGELGQPPEAKGPFDLLSLDTIAGFAKYGNTKIYLHVVVDYFSRYTWTFPSKSTSITTYQQVLKRVLQDGSPKRLLTDRAPAFTSPKFRSFLLNRNIHSLITTSNNPQANGLCERLNATLTGKLRLLHLGNPKIAWTKLSSNVSAWSHNTYSWLEWKALLHHLHPRLGSRRASMPALDTLPALPLPSLSNDRALADDASLTSLYRLMIDENLRVPFTLHHQRDCSASRDGHAILASYHSDFPPYTEASAPSNEHMGLIRISIRPLFIELRALSVAIRMIEHDRGGSSKSPTVQDETLANLSTSPDVLLPTLRVTLKGNRTEKTARAIIDTRSQRSYILHSTAMEMEYEQSRREFFRHSLFGGSSTDVVEHEVYTIHLSDINNSYRCEFEALGQPLICGSIPPVCPRSFLEGSEELDVSDLMRDRIEVLIGADIAGRLLTDDQRRISSGLVAIRTKLGWTVMGKIPPTEVRDDISSLCVTTLLSLDLENLWKLDAIGVSDAEVEKKTQSLQAEMEEHFAHTTTRDIEGRYEVALPWVQDKERIPSNKDLAENQLSSVRRKLEEVGDMKNFQNVEETEKFVKESTELLSTACFNLRDWDSYVEKTTLHIFCDASQFAYATCIFLRIEKEDRVDIQLIQARTRVAPLKKLTIPRLELLACLIGARLAANVIQDLEFEEIPRFYWTDSTNALCWIQREDNWAAFVMNRVKEIHNLSSPESWRHIPGRLNPADLPSRGCSAESLKETRWWEGPAWLKVSQEEWPKSTIIPDLEIVYSERRKTILNTLEVGVPDLDLIDNQTLSRKYQYIKRVREDLRERFRIEYFGFLRQETRRLKTTIPFKVGDMVLIGQESLKRLHWPLARIIQLYPGKDGLVRVAKVKTSSGDKIRPIQKLYNLEITPEIRCRDPLTERSPTQEVRLTTEEDPLTSQQEQHHIDTPECCVKLRTAHQETQPIGSTELFLSMFESSRRQLKVQVVQAMIIMGSLVDMASARTRGTGHDNPDWEHFSVAGRLSSKRNGHLCHEEQMPCAAAPYMEYKCCSSCIPGSGALTGCVTNSAPARQDLLIPLIGRWELGLSIRPVAGRLHSLDGVGQT